MFNKTNNPASHPSITINNTLALFMSTQLAKWRWRLNPYATIQSPVEWCCFFPRIYVCSKFTKLAGMCEKNAKINANKTSTISICFDFYFPFFALYKSSKLWVGSGKFPSTTRQSWHAVRLCMASSCFRWKFLQGFFSIEGNYCWTARGFWFMSFLMRDRNARTESRLEKHGIRSKRKNSKPDRFDLYWQIDSILTAWLSIDRIDSTSLHFTFTNTTKSHQKSLIFSSGTSTLTSELGKAKSFTRITIILIPTFTSLF